MILTKLVAVLSFCPLDTGRKLNVQLKLKRLSGRLLSVFYTFKFTSCVQVKSVTLLKHELF